MRETLAGMVIDVNAVAFSNAKLPMLETPSGRMIDVSEVV
jgi:hypothetical protein